MLKEFTNIEFWTPATTPPPYDTNILIMREDGNVVQDVWYDETWEEYVEASGKGVVGKRCGPIVAWAEIPPFNTHNSEPDAGETRNQ